MSIRTLDSVELAGKRVLIRADLNVPLDSGVITSDTRIRAALGGIRDALERGGAVMVTSHLGRPVEGEPVAEFSLAPVAARLSELLGRPVPLIADWIDGVHLAAGDVVMLENVRFLRGEKACDDALSRKMASLCDVFVMDAFGTAHRAQASTVGVARYAPEAVAGPLLQAELDALGRALDAPARPVVAIVGGSKVSTKLTVLEALADKVDTLIVGGGIANTFIAAAGNDVGDSLMESDMVEMARSLRGAGGADIPLPVDVVVADRFAADAKATVRPVSGVESGERILDLGPETVAEFARRIAAAGTVVWNGPVGVFEFDAFGAGTKAIAEAVAASKAFSIAGGGDTLAAIEKYGVGDRVSYISTGGGAFLEFLEGKTLPAVEVLEQRAGTA